MGINQTTNTLTEIKQEADDFITNILKKVPENQKMEVLRLVEGFALCAETNGKKVG